MRKSRDKFIYPILNVHQHQILLTEERKKNYYFIERKKRKRKIINIILVNLSSQNEKIF